MGYILDENGQPISDELGGFLWDEDGPDIECALAGMTATPIFSGASVVIASITVTAAGMTTTPIFSGCSVVPGTLASLGPDNMIAAPIFSGGEVRAIQGLLNLTMTRRQANG